MTKAPTPTKNPKKQRDIAKTPPLSSITQSTNFNYTFVSGSDILRHFDYTLDLQVYSLGRGINISDIRFFPDPDVLYNCIILWRQCEIHNV